MKMKLTYLFLIIIAVLIGFYLGNACADSGDPLIVWLGYSLDFGFGPVNINLSAFTVDFGLHFSINALQILLIALAITLTPKVAAAIK